MSAGTEKIAREEQVAYLDKRPRGYGGNLMTNLKAAGLLAGAMALAIVSPALAHHSHAMFDHGQQISIKGTVTNFDFRNPHAALFVDVQKDGKTVNYWFEMSNLPNMVRRGIGVATFKPGDKVTVNMHPLKDGRPGGSYVTISTADGKTYD